MIPESIRYNLILHVVMMRRLSYVRLSDSAKITPNTPPQEARDEDSGRATQDKDEDL